MKPASLGLMLSLGTAVIAKGQENSLPSPPPERVVPSSRRLSRSELETYLQGKKVALFWEAHLVREAGQEFHYLVDDMHFRALIPSLKRLGYTHVALEVEYKHEEKVRMGISSIIDVDGIGMTAVTIGPIALQYGLEILCIDNRDQNRKFLRDEYMEQRIAQVISQGGKVAYFVGAAHLRLVNKDPLIASIELNPSLSGGGQNIAIIYQKVLEEGAKPLGKRLVEKYGVQQVALVGMDSCSDGAIPRCFLK